MDFITHTLIGTGVARLVAPEKRLLPQCALAAVLASLLPDSDSALALLGQEYYGRYHRVASHSILGLALIALLAAGVAWWAFRARPRWRRFGWFVSENQKADDSDPPPVGFSILLIVAVGAVAMHWVGDWITGYGNITPLWPWRNRDISLAAVNSFDWVLFASTLAWHVTIRTLDWPRGREALLTGAWFLWCAGYVTWRVYTGQSGIW